MRGKGSDPGRAVSQLKRRLWLLPACAAVLALAGWAGGNALVRPTYRATARLRVDLNLGGIPINSSYDASGDAVRIVQTNVLSAARQTLHGPALRDPAALYRVRCGRDAADRVVICTTTGTDQEAVAAVLSQLMQTFVPLDIETQTAEFHSLYRDLVAQYRQLSAQAVRLERRYRSIVNRARHSHQLSPKLQKPIRVPQSTVSWAASSLAVNINVRRQILLHERAIKRQIAAVASTLHIFGRTTTAIETPVGVYAAGAAGGLALGLLLGLLLALSSTFKVQRSTRGAKRVEVEDPVRPGSKAE